MKTYSYLGKTKEEAILMATEELHEVKENLIIIEEEEQKKGILSSKKISIKVVEKREANNSIKEEIITLLKKMGISANVEISVKENIPNFRIFSDNDALLIGKNGKNLKALSILIGQVIKKQLGRNYKFLIDINSYKEKHQKDLERLAKKIAKEVLETKIEVKLDSMNSYERRIIHTSLSEYNDIVTVSEGEEPNRYIIIKIKGE